MLILIRHLRRSACRERNAYMRIALAGDKEELILAEVNLSGATGKRNQRPYTSLRRTELYE